MPPSLASSSRTPIATAFRPALRVRRISHGMVWACRALLVLLPVAFAAYWVVASDAQLLALSQLPAQVIPSVASLAPWQRLVGGVVMAVPLGLLLVGVWHAQRCFARFAQGQVFTAEATARLRRFAGWVAAAALGALLAGVVASVVLTWNNPPGQRHLAIGIGSDHVFTLFFAGLVWLMAAVIGEGQALAEENQGFV
ncbi:DUF2975 domain-containing protein [Hydrogenophaga electricum]|uniref:DUF2975 domain-containing protein n=1 Tax=Hydrogenophaga electricum TaxID=1230953 RepID=UPI0024E066F3|nr:DUF2975 domain-containing protein [Hydrogenophaga electricum]